MRNLILVAWFLDSGDLYSLRILPDNHVGQFMKSGCITGLLPFGKRQVLYSNTTAFNDFLGSLSVDKRLKLENVVNGITPKEFDNLGWRGGLYLGVWDLVD